MKLRHLLRSVQIDIIDAQRKSYQYSEKLIKKHKKSLFPIPFAKGTEVELSLHFALEQPRCQNESRTEDLEVIREKLKAKLKTWMQEVFTNSFDSDQQHASNQKLDVPQIIGKVCTSLDSSWDQLIAEDGSFSYERFMDWLKSTEPLMYVDFASYVESRMEKVLQLTGESSLRRKNLDMNVIVDAHALGKLKPQSIHTAKLVIKVDDINLEEYE